MRLWWCGITKFVMLPVDTTMAVMCHVLFVCCMEMFDCFKVTLSELFQRRSTWPTVLVPIVSSPNNNCFGIRSSDMRATCPAHRSCVSATALIHRTARPSISAMSSLLDISPKYMQLVMIWFRSHVAAPHIGPTLFVLTVAP